LVNFKDLKINSPADCKKYIEKQFFSTNEGTINQYFGEVSGGKISFTGDVVGPYDLPHEQAYYTRGESGLGKTVGTSTQDLGLDAIHATIAADSDLGKYDNSGRAKGWVDGFVVVHAGKGAEVQTKEVRGDSIWSCKWTLPEDKVVSQTKNNSTTKVYSFLTIPEVPALGLTCHEIGHLLFGWPDLYDVSNHSRGIGHWCLMGTGCWNSLPDQNAGSTPCHPSAWCKLDQEWVDVVETTGETEGVVSIKEVKTNATHASAQGPAGSVTKIWPKGQKGGNEYFLLENRMKSGYDKCIPGEGLLSEFPARLKLLI
jgi:immune inhibitor A